MKTIDIFELSRTRRTVEGTLTLDELPELSEALEGNHKAADVTFEAVGTAGRNDLPGADLVVRATLTTACVRCGKPYEVKIDKEIPFLFTQTEEEANAMPVDEDGDYEVVVGSRKFDLAQWVQEELILSLPAFPMHDDCEPDEEQLRTHETPETLEKPNPFACLAGFKAAKKG